MSQIKKEKRQLLIIEQLRNHPFMKIEELCHTLHASPATIRRDLTDLEESKSIIRINGGAIINKDQPSIPKETIQKVEFLDEKNRIAEEAISHVRAGDTIFMDTGSTNLIIADKLTKLSNITIITNSVSIAYKFINRKDLSVIICGGTLGEADPDSILGPVAEKMISMFRANLCFLGTSGLHVKQGITDRYLGSARIKEKMIEHSTKVCLVTDHSKFGIVNTAFVCPMDNIHHIITDDMAPIEEVNYLISTGITVTLV